MRPWHSLAGKTIWITGGAGHLGAPITAALDAACAKVICLDLGDRAAALVQARGLARTLPRSLDVTGVDALPGAIDAIISEHGVPDGLVHLPTASSRARTVETMPLDEFRGTFDRALTPTFVLCRTLAERMRPRGHGAFVLFASMYGVVAPDPRIYHAPQTPNPIDYGAAKAALIQMTRYLAVHYGPAGLRFNCVTPGPFPNPAVQAADPAFIAELARKNPLGRIGRPEEMAGPVLFLLGDGASYVTGHSLVVDGGWTIW
ncbi:MAG: SDR family oxidoreductase [Opitutaceae bacterium]|nr:SDR family oxidoreductase [Opitutaceae bacterium]